MQRLVPELDGWRLQLDENGKGVLLPSEQWRSIAPSQAPTFLMRLLQSNAMAQHGLNLRDVLRGNKIGIEDLEVIYSPFFEALLCFPQIPQLITCHDLTPLTLPASRRAWFKYRFWQPKHLHCATRVIAISRHVANQLIAFGLPADRISVVPNGIRIERPALIEPASEDLVVLARHDANKNLSALVRALATVQTRLPQWRGVVRIIGREGKSTPAIQRYQRALPRPDGLECIPSMDSETLLQTLRDSLALLSASLEEGFDYPVLEAKAEGLPTLISSIPVHQEFHQDSSLFFPADDDGTVLTEHLSTLLKDHSAWRQLSAAGRHLAQSLSIQRQAESIRPLISNLAR